MGQALDYLSISGFKSIRRLVDFELRSLNVIVGANGAGKSNFVSFFRILRAMAEEGLATFVAENGGADGFFFGGPKVTPEIEAHLKFGQNEYQFTLAPTASEKLMVKSESTFSLQEGKGKDYSGGRFESMLRQWKTQTPCSVRPTPHPGQPLSTEAHICNAISGWLVYHFHDTSLTAGMRRYHSVHDWRELNPDASNIAAFLLRLRQEHPQDYEKIKETIQIIAPFFDDFILEPTMQGASEDVRLEWRHKGRSTPFQPWQFSDGTLRFICLATALCQPNPPSTVVIDEPELGLHPFALDVLAGLIRDAADRTQLIVSTQSPTLLNHFAPPEVIVIDRAEGASRFRRLDTESLAEWLNDFTLGELWHKNVFDGGPAHE